MIVEMPGLAGISSGGLWCHFLFLCIFVFSANRVLHFDKWVSDILFPLDSDLFHTYSILNFNKGYFGLFLIKLRNWFILYLNESSYEQY